MAKMAPRMMRPDLIGAVAAQNWQSVVSNDVAGRFKIRRENTQAMAISPKAQTSRMNEV
jgi:hypothetical protein